MGADNPLGPARFTGQGLDECSLLLTREVLTGQGHFSILSPRPVRLPTRLGSRGLLGPF